MVLHRFSALIFVCGAVSLIGVAPLACGKKKSSNTETDTGGTGGTGGASGKMNVEFISSQLSVSSLMLADKVLSRRFALPSVGYGRSLNHSCAQQDSAHCLETTANGPYPVGHSTQTSLESLSYRLGYVALANTATVTGSGWSNPVGEWAIYSASDAIPSDYSPQAAETDPLLLNILDKANLTKWARELAYTENNINTYNYAFLNWAQAIRFKASVTLTDGTKLYSKKATSYELDTNMPSTKAYKSITTDLSTGPAEEAVVWSNNGGTLFKLQTPFAITRADVDAKTNFKIAFVFDPESLIQGDSGFGPQTKAVSDNTRTLQVPYLDLAPVVARSSETIMRETYLFRSGESSNKFDVRLSLYYVKEDETKGIRAVTNNVIYTQTASDFSNRALENIYSITSNTDGSITLNDSEGVPVFANFKRLNAVSDTGTLTNFCIKTSNCINLPYTLVSSGAIDGPLTAVTPSP